MGPTYRRIWHFMREFRRGIAAAVGTSLAASVAFALLPWPIRYIIDDVLLGNSLRLGPLGHWSTVTTEDKIAVGSALAGVYLVINDGRGVDVGELLPVRQRRLHDPHLARADAAFARLSLGFTPTAPQVS